MIERTARIADIKIGERHRKDMGNLEVLTDSIRAVGLLQPIGITDANELVFGERRLRACRDSLGWETIPARVVNVSSIVTGEYHENEVRKDFTPSERVAIAETVAAAMPERQGGDRRSGTFQDGTNSALKGETRTIVAKRAGFGNDRTFRQAKEVVDAAKAEPAKYGRLVAEMDLTGRVAGVHKKLTVAKKAEAIESEPPPLPKGPFRVIVADPPWPYHVRPNDPSHRGSTPYPQMSVEEICALPVAEIAHDDAVLWLWTTNAHVFHAKSVMDAWGFEHKTIVTWVKDRMGTGHWLRGRTEHCLMAVRGKPVVTLGNQTTVIFGELREHSRKPDEFYALVETLCPAPPNGRAELFQRTPRQGWVGHGDEVAAGNAEARKAKLIREKGRAA